MQKIKNNTLERMTKMERKSLLKTEKTTKKDEIYVSTKSEITERKYVLQRFYTHYM